MDELTISVTIADRPYRLTVKREEEENIRRAAGDINTKVRNYAENFAYNDKQDLLAMVALEKAIHAIEIENGQQNSLGKLRTDLADIDKKLPELTD